MISGPMAVWVVARKEIMEHVRTKRIFIIGGLFFITFMAAAVLGIAFLNEETTDPGMLIRSVLMFYFSAGWVGGFTFTAVLAIALSADAICGEWKDRSLFLLLSKPISREAMVAGKILAAFLSVAMVFIIASLVTLVVMLIAIGLPDGESWWRIFAGFGVVLLGILPFVGVGILASALFRTPVSSFVVALGLWFLVFPLLGTMGGFIELARHGTYGEEPVSLIFALLSPTSLMQYAAAVWVGEDAFVGFFGQSVLDDPVLVIGAMLVHTVVYLSLAFWVVKNRDYA